MGKTDAIGATRSTRRRGASTRTVWSAARRGGHVTVVGVGGRDSTVEFSALELFRFGGTLHGCVYGSSDPATDVPQLLDLAAAGRLDLAGLQTPTTDLAGLSTAFDRLRRGHGARTLVRLTEGRP